jgi:hypothetical protein
MAMKPHVIAALGQIGPPAKAAVPHLAEGLIDRLRLDRVLPLEDRRHRRVGVLDRHHRR